MRPYRPGDAPALLEAVSSSRADLAPWLPWVEQMHTLQQAEESVRRLCARWLLRDDLTLGVWHRTTGELLGGTGLHRIDWDVPSFEVGYWLRTSAQGRGYMTETVRALTQFAFELLHAVRVEIRCERTNVRSAAVARRLGFIHEGTLRSSRRDAAGYLSDTLVFALIREDMQGDKAGAPPL